MADNVNKPSHYNREGAMETIDEMIMLFGIEEVMSFCKLNAWKYRARAMNKNGKEDMEKSDWYLRKYQELKGLYVFNDDKTTKWPIISTIPTYSPLQGVEATCTTKNN